jgi:hypothetical protein
MNIVKFKPVGTPSAPHHRIKVTQSKGALYGAIGAGVAMTGLQRKFKRRLTVKEANRTAGRQGFVRSGVRHV